MPRQNHIMRALALTLVLAATTVRAQGNNNNDNLPNLSTVTQATALPSDSTSADSSSATSAATPASTTSADSTTQPQSSTAQSSSAESSPSTSDPSSSTESATVTFATTSGTAPVVSLSNLPTIPGAGVPTLVIPYTANAPFMQKSNLPEGTVFIAVGAVLAFLGSCVLLWRGLVAWSINRSVNRAAHAAMLGTEKTPTWGSTMKNGSVYKEFAASSMSLDALNSAGKHIRPSHSQDEAGRHRKSTAPPAGLFFSPTAQASNRASSVNLLNNMENRGSTHLPAGYYASPSVSDPAGGRGSVALGASIAPYARSSLANPSPPTSPGLHNSRGTTSHYYTSSGGITTSRDGLRVHDALSRPSREALRGGGSRDGYGSQRNSYMYTHPHPSASSLYVGTGYGGAAGSSSEHLAGNRAPSAVLDEMFENHGHGPRERF